MNRGDVFEYAINAFRSIKKNGLHGCMNEVPQHYSRGVDVLEENIETRFARSVWIYYRHHNSLPDLIDPQTFTEKQVLFKFFGPIPNLCPSDKLNSHLYLSTDHASTIKTPERIWKSKKPELPDNSAIPAGNYYFKSNHGAGTNLPVVFPISANRREELEVIAAHWLTKVHGSRPSLWWNGMMERYVYLEEDLSDNDSDIPDWKFFTCNGCVELYQVDVNRSRKHRQTVYSRSGTFLDKELYFNSGSPIEPPEFLEKMVTAAEDIGRHFDFIRVDMFVRNGTIYLGEIGLVPNGASLAIRSPELDWKLGAAWKAPWLGKVDPTYSTGHYQNSSAIFHAHKE